MDIKIVVWIGGFITLGLLTICSTIEKVLIERSNNEKEMYISNLKNKKTNEEE